MKERQIIRGKALRPNAGIKAWYVKELTALARRMTSACTERILSLIRAERKAAMDESPAVRRRILLNKLNREFEELFRQKAQALAEGMLQKQTKYANSSVVSSMAAFGSASGYTPHLTLYTPRVREIIKTAVYNNVNYIKSIHSQYFTQITGAVSRAVLDEEGIGYLKEQLLKYAGMTKRRARNIAVDQTNKAYEAISYQKMADAGIEKWEWVHGGGTKTVRQTHIRDVKDGGLNHSIHKMGEKVWDPQAFKKKGGEYKGALIEPGQLPYCTCFRRPVITLGD